MTHGRQVRDWILAEDVASGFCAALERGPFDGRTLELGTGVGISLLTVVQTVYRLIGRGGNLLIGRLPARPGEAAEQVADPAPAAQLLGWRATVPLEEGLKRVIYCARP